MISLSDAAVRMMGMRDNELEILDKYGGRRVVSIELGRKKIPAAINFAIRLTLRTDDLYHLFAIVALDGVTLLVEKNETVLFRVLSYDDVRELRSGAEMQLLDPDFVTVSTFAELVDRMKALMSSRFLPYDALDNNCQNFLLNLVVCATSTIPPSMSQFILQPDVREMQQSRLLKVLPVVDVMRGVTTAAYLGASLAQTAARAGKKVFKRLTGRSAGMNRHWVETKY